MEKLLISACLLGEKVRYNGSGLFIGEAEFEWLKGHFELVPVCPEVAGGLPTPREPAEIEGGNAGDLLSGKAKVITVSGKDVSAAFADGAGKALELCQKQGIRYALLTDGSPSCGSSQVYDGTFSGTKQPGEGLTTALLRRHGIRVFSQHQLGELKKVLAG